MMHEAGETWSNSAGYVYPRHQHPYRKTLTCLKGSITFTVHAASGDREVHLKEGDILELPPGTVHSAKVGPHGCTCSEVHRR